jgi:hypothetical protein
MVSKPIASRPEVGVKAPGTHSRQTEQKEAEEDLADYELGNAVWREENHREDGPQVPETVRETALRSVRSDLRFVRHSRIMPDLAHTTETCCRVPNRDSSPETRPLGIAGSFAVLFGSLRPSWQRHIRHYALELFGRKRIIEVVMRGPWRGGWVAPLLGVGLIGYCIIWWSWAYGGIFVFRGGVIVPHGWMVIVWTISLVAGAVTALWSRRPPQLRRDEDVTAKYRDRTQIVLFVFGPIVLFWLFAAFAKGDISGRERVEIGCVFAVVWGLIFWVSIRWGDRD